MLTAPDPKDRSMTPPRSTFGSARALVAIVVVCAAALVAVLVYRPGGDGSSLRPLDRAVDVPRVGPTELPDLGPVAALRAAAPAAAFDAGALDHVLGVVAAGTLGRRASERLPTATVAAFDGAAAGRLVEVAGTVRALDREAFTSAANAGWDQLWAFALEDGGARVVVVHPGTSKALDGARPVEVRGDVRDPVQEGDRVRVRGVLLQRRTGSVGRVSLDAPTWVVVGREYRITGPVQPPPLRLADVPFASVLDRTFGQTKAVEDDAHWGLLAWMDARGAAAVSDDLRSGALPVQAWGRDEFLTWKHELEAERGEGADGRTWTRAARGRVFVLTGWLADAVSEDWDLVRRNPYDVDHRVIYWLLSDHYAHAGIPFFSSFPVSCFPGVSPPDPKRARDPRAGVRVYGVFVRNFSYEPRGGPGDITVPSFHLLHVEPVRR